MLGVLAGMRSMAAPAALGRLSSAGVLDGLSGPLALVTTSGFSATANLLTVGELIADKLPGNAEPDRRRASVGSSSYGRPGGGGFVFRAEAACCGWSFDWSSGRYWCGLRRVGVAPEGNPGPGLAGQFCCTC